MAATISKFETVVEMFRQHLEQNPRITDWQLRQAIDAVLIYKHQFRKSQLPDAPSSGPGLDSKALLEKARQFASLKRYARSTRKTYLAKRHRPLPTVLSPDEVRRIIDNVEAKHRLMVRLIYGTGMRMWRPP
ncbi:MAG: hypothetical protein H8E53_11385 [Planctomycetes bacterium]|nr:hypothetical protein [Planctomycetota bacterium]